MLLYLHKETLSQTETMRNILFDFKGHFFSEESRSPKIKGQKNVSLTSIWPFLEFLR